MARCSTSGPDAIAGRPTPDGQWEVLPAERPTQRLLSEPGDTARLDTHLAGHAGRRDELAAGNKSVISAPGIERRKLRTALL
jgi:hypothetical protein